MGTSHKVCLTLLSMTHAHGPCPWPLPPEDRWLYYPKQRNVSDCDVFKVSIAIGIKWWDLDSRAYFSLFLATALASLVASDMYDVAKVSTQVKSQTKH